MTKLPPKNKQTRENDNRVNTERDTTPVHLTDQKRNKQRKTTIKGMFSYYVMEGRGCLLHSLHNKYGKGGAKAKGLE